MVAALAVATLSVAAASTVGTARAAHCDATDLVIVSRTVVRASAGTDNPAVRGPAANPNAIACALARDVEVDTRLLMPAANEVGVRYTNDAGVDWLDGSLDGLGFDRLPIRLERHVVDTTGTGDPKGIFVLYDTPEFLPIPAGPGGQGTVTATVHLPAGRDISVTFHTAT